MQCVILVASSGSHRDTGKDGSPTSQSIPSMMPVHERPFLEYLLENAARFGFTDILLLAAHEHHLILQHAFPQGLFRAQEQTLQITVVSVPAQSGISDALQCAAPFLESSFLLLYGLSFFDFNWLDLCYEPWQPHEKARMSLCYVDDATYYDIVTLGDDASVTSYKTSVEDDHHTQEAALINGGVLWMRREVIDSIPVTPATSPEQTLFPALAAHKALTARIYTGLFIDIDRPESYREAQHLFPLRRAAVFFDRDGVLNIDTGYVSSPERWQWIEGAISTIKQCNDEGVFVFVVTNQSGVGRGYFGEGAVQALHEWVQKQLAVCGAHIDAFRFCPHHPEASVAAYRCVCSCRKPAPGMIYDILKHWNVDQQKSVLIGDKQSDIDAGQAAGLKTILQ